MDLSLVVADELRTILKQHNRAIPPQAVTQVAEAFKAARAILGSDAAYQEFVTRVATRMTGDARSAQAKADGLWRTRFPQYYESPEPAPEEKPVFKMRPKKFVI